MRGIRLDGIGLNLKAGHACSARCGVTFIRREQFAYMYRYKHAGFSLVQQSFHTCDLVVAGIGQHLPLKNQDPSTTTHQ